MDFVKYLIWLLTMIVIALIISVTGILIIGISLTYLGKLGGIIVTAWLIYTAWRILERV
jgi:hypothetical protein